MDPAAAHASGGLARPHQHARGQQATVANGEHLRRRQASLRPSTNERMGVSASQGAVVEVDAIPAQSAHRSPAAELLLLVKATQRAAVYSKLASEVTNRRTT